MALKAKLTKAEHDALAEPLKEHYKASGDDYVLDAEGVEDVSGLKSALEKEKKERRELKTKLEAEAARFKDIDPERARAALAKVQEIDEKHLIDQGEFDRLLKKRSDEFEAKEAEKDRLIAENQKRLDTFELINPVRDALLKAGVMPDRIEDAVVAASRFVKLDDKRKVVVLDNDSDPSGKTLDEFASTEFKESKPWLYAATGAGGSGAPANSTGNGGKKAITRKEFNELPAAQQRTVALQAGKGEIALTD